MDMLNYTVHSGGALQGVLQVPGDKSISHRAVLLAALAEGVTRIEGLLRGADVHAMMSALRGLGVGFTDLPEGGVEVRGVGLRGLRAPQKDLDLGNSGTAIRLLCGVLAAQSFPARLVGDASLSKRPMERVLAPLRSMGADVASDDGCAPLQFRPVPGPGLQAVRHTMEVASAQVKSALLLAGLYAEGGVTVCETAPTRDHSERMLRHFGAQVRRTESGKDQGCITLAGGARLQAPAAPLRVPADLSSAAFFLVGASILPGSDLTLRSVGINPTRNGVIPILQAMGADIDCVPAPAASGAESDSEPIADIRVRHAQLRGITIDPKLVPLAIDEFPVLAVAAACATGETVIEGAAELRVKESDRIRATVEALQQLGVEARELPDGMVIRGRGGESLQPGTVHSYHDHRIAMALAIAGAAAAQPVRVLDCGLVATSFPNFVECARSAGLMIETSEE